jgi:hypothetical protein
VPAIALEGSSIRITASIPEFPTDPAKDLELPIEGTWTLELTNPTSQPLRDVHLFNYPAQYGEEPQLGDILFERIYPSGFSPGGMELGAVTSTDESGTKPATVEELGGTEGPVLRVVLAKPLLPGQTATLVVPFTTIVPRKYGVFGNFRRTLTLDGFHPLLLPLGTDGRWIDGGIPPLLPQSMELEIPTTWGGVVGGHVFHPIETQDNSTTAFLSSGYRATAAGQPAAFSAAAPGLGTLEELPSETSDRRRIRFRDEGCRWTSVAFRRHMRQQNLPMSDGSTVTWIGRPLRTYQRRWVRRAVEGVR